MILLVLSSTFADMTSLYGQIFTVDERLNYILENLTRAVEVCKGVSDDSDDYTKTYSYATGWSTSAMNSAISDLNSILSDIREDS